jgi:hypothetical protein
MTKLLAAIFLLSLIAATGTIAYIHPQPMPACDMSNC